MPSDLQEFQTPLPHRDAPPVFKVPIVGIGSDGIARDISAPPGKRVALKNGGTINVRNFFFSRSNISVKSGSKLTWLFQAANNEVHNVTLASGPRGFGSPNYSNNTSFSFRFKTKGKYRIFCALHPVAMTETVTVR
jgi:plastocyanin